jgi:hypothetical protein
MKRQWKVAGGFVVLAVLVGLGVVPARRAMTVRVAAPPKERPAARKAPDRRGPRLPLLRALARRVRRWRR